jgi:tungstate transport system substrate-binding protein
MKIQRRRLLQTSVGGAVIGLAGCSATGAGEGSGDPAATGTDGDGEAEAGTIGDGELILATTTSTLTPDSSTNSIQSTSPLTG